MKVKSHLHSMMRGSVAGLTYTANSYSAIVARARTIPIQPMTSYQQIVRGCLSYASAIWENLTEAQRLSWADYASTVLLQGPQGSYQPTGRDEFIAGYSFVRYLLLRGLTAGTPVVNAPEFDGRANLTVLPETYVGPGTGIKFGIYNPNLVQVCCLVRKSMALSPTRNFWNGPWQTPNHTSLTIDADDNDSIEISGLIEGRAYFVCIRGVEIDTLGPGHRVTNEYILRMIATTTV